MQTSDLQALHDMVPHAVPYRAAQDDRMPTLQDGLMRGQQVAAMIRHVHPNVTPAELRHFEVMVDRQASSIPSSCLGGPADGFRSFSNPAQHPATALAYIWCAVSG